MHPQDHSPTLPIYWDDAFLEYRPPDGAYYLGPTDDVAVDEPHPERPERLTNVGHVIERHLDVHASWSSFEPATTDELLAVHERTYVDSLSERAADAPGFVTADTWLDEATLRAARHAAGAAIAAGRRAVADPNAVPYALVRPPGHHAQPDRADGYCLLNNVALAAEHALRVDGVDAVAVVDWDVHHGNGTQEAFYGRDDVLLVSVHNDHGSWHPETHPQTGRPDEHGEGDGAGHTVNVPVPAGTGDRGYGLAFDRIVEPVVGAFDPDLVLVSAGQDPGLMDPQGRNVVTKDGFRGMGRRVRELADRHAGGRLAVVQEGGYQLSHLPYATLGVLEGVLGVDTGVEDPFAGELDENLRCVRRALRSVEEDYARFWPALSDE